MICEVIEKCCGCLEFHVLSSFNSRSKTHLFSSVSLSDIDRSLVFESRRRKDLGER